MPGITARPARFWDDRIISKNYLFKKIYYISFFLNIFLSEDYRDTFHFLLLTNMNLLNLTSKVCPWIFDHREICACAIGSEFAGLTPPPTPYPFNSPVLDQFARDCYAVRKGSASILDCLQTVFTIHQVLKSTLVWYFLMLMWRYL